MSNYPSKADLYSLARILSKEYTRDKYKSFLIENGFVEREMLEDPDGSFSKIMVNEEFIRETLFYISFNLFEDRISEIMELLYREDKLLKLDSDGGQLEAVENKQESPEKRTRNKIRKVEKTVFISYRREGGTPWALLVYKYLTEKGFDVFFDFEGISSGDFEQIIIGNIKARAHFLVILTPSALDRCNQPGDWLRREIETAIEEKRNIVPIFFDGFSFGTPAISEKLSGRLGKLSKYNGLDVPIGYFDEAMKRLRENYLNIALDAVLHPISDEVQKVNEEQKLAANEAIAQQKDTQYQAPGFQYIRLDPKTKVKEYMHKDTFDGYKVSLKCHILNDDGSDKDTGILHFQVLRVEK